MENIGIRIKKLRESKNWTQEYMASQLKISQNTYSRLENENVKLSTERLKQIAAIFEVPAEYLLNSDAPVYNFHNENASIKYAGHIENIYDDQKEVFQKSIQILEDQLKHYQQENKRLMVLLEKTLK
jgi:transcriptional regulator with XRE-family HTH domain